MQNMQTDMTGGPWWSKMVVYWLEDQVALTFHSDLLPSAGKAAIVAALNLAGLNQFLNMRGYNLKPFTQDDVPFITNTSSTNEQTSDLYDVTGKYIFHQPSGQGSLIHCLFHVEQTAAYAMTGSSIMGGGMGSGSSMYGGMGSMSGNGDTVRAVVSLLNSNLDGLRREAKVPIVAAAPNWLSGGTSDLGCGTHGCPQSPPIPVEDDSTIWHITLPELSADMQQRTGAGVTVFVLDTRPAIGQVTDAAQRAGSSNALLQMLVSQLQGAAPTIVFNDQDQQLPTILEDGSSQQPFTGRDICGRLCGYNVVDHGLTVTGIIRDVAPGTKIECIRVLNNYGVGTVGVLTYALEDIHNRMAPIDPTTGKAGDLYNQPVVINLSLVAVLHQEEMVSWWSGGSLGDPVRATTDTEPLTVHLQSLLRSLVSLGAVIVGAAGNDSDIRQCIPEHHPQAMIVSTQRMLPRFPAAFPEVLSVGAVDRTGNAAAYSNYPVAPGSTQNEGIATYGGGIPVPVFPQSEAPTNPAPADGSAFNPAYMTDVDRTKLDALVGVFTSPNYPALSVDDVPSEYKAPNDHAWAYWSGTSFATPIISGVAARLLEALAASNLPPRLWHSEVIRAFTTAQGQQDRLLGSGATLAVQPEFSQGGVHISQLKAQQTGSSTGQQAEAQKTGATV